MGRWRGDRDSEDSRWVRIWRILLLVMLPRLNWHEEPVDPSSMTAKTSLVRRGWAYYDTHGTGIHCSRDPFRRIGRDSHQWCDPIGHTNQHHVPILTFEWETRSTDRLSGRMSNHPTFKQAPNISAPSCNPTVVCSMSTMMAWNPVLKANGAISGWGTIRAIREQDTLSS